MIPNVQDDGNLQLRQRVTALESRVSALEGAPAAEARDDARADHQVFWALERLKRDVVPAVGGGGAVLFTGSIELPTGERAEWQEAHGTDELIDEDWSPLAASLSALAHPVRLLLLREILRGTRAVAELASLPPLGTTGQLYHHLRQLTATGWLRSSARGRYVVPAERVVPLLNVLIGVRR